MKNLYEFYLSLGFELNLVENDLRYFSGDYTLKDGTKLVVIHTGDIHRLYSEKTGMVCFLIPNSYIEYNNVLLVQKILKISVFFKGLFPKLYQQIVLLDTE